MIVMMMKLYKYGAVGSIVCTRQQQASSIIFLPS